MKISDRAKIFGAFSPLKDFYEALSKKEKIVVSKAELADDRVEEIDFALHQIDVGDMVCAVHYKNGEYVKTTGCISRFVPEEKALYIVKTKIDFDDIYDIEILN